MANIYVPLRHEVKPAGLRCYHEVDFFISKEIIVQKTETEKEL
jgi:hypothetical protein